MAGLTEGKHCSVCHEILVAQTTVDALGHSYDDPYDDTCNECGFVREVGCAHKRTVVVSGQAATCTETGLTDGVKCAKCNEILVAQQTIPAKGHTETTDGAVVPTCTKWGASGKVECTLCHITVQEQTFLEPVGHTYLDGICSACHQLKPDFTDISQYNSHEGYAFFEAAPDGNAMRAFYEDMEKELSEFHHSDTINAPFYQNHPEWGKVHNIGFFNYAQYGLTREQAYSVFLLFRKDHPAYYWLSSLVYYNSTVIAVTTIEEYANGKDRSRYNDIMYESIAKYVALTDGETSAYTIALTYYDALLADFEYAYDEYNRPESAQWAHSIMGGFLYNKFVCEGYAKLFQLLLNYSDVQNMYITGEAGGDHAWNLVCMDDGNWYWFDLTWADASGNYLYFCALDNTFTDHRPDAFYQYGQSFNITLPSRADSPFASEAVLEIGETFAIGNSVYYLASAGSVKQLKGPKIPADKLVYNGAVYTIISDKHHDHIFANWITVKEPTYTRPGKAESTCVCGMIAVLTIDQIG